ncbi:MAG: hypothetical protein R3E77_15065 [Steroidobacteraceae bacterium]
MQFDLDRGFRQLSCGFTVIPPELPLLIQSDVTIDIQSTVGTIMAYARRALPTFQLEKDAPEIRLVIGWSAVIVIAQRAPSSLVCI